MMIRSYWVAGFALLLAGSAQASSCEQALAEVATMEWDELFDAAVLQRECVAARTAAADLIENMIVLDAVPADIDAEEVVQSMRVLSMVRLRDELVAGDVGAAQKRLAALTLELMADIEADADDVSGELLERLVPIGHVLEGSAMAPVETAIASPGPDWLLRTGMCGMRGFEFDALPTAADAWHAIGRSDVAVQVLLLEQWNDAIASRRLPPRLAEYAERAFGGGAFEREWELALSAIRIRHAPAGGFASMPLFGIDVPLPLGVHTWHDDATTWWADEQTLREQIRGRYTGLEAIE